MAASVTVYDNLNYLLATAGIDLSTGNIICGLSTSSYTPDIVNHTFVSSLTAAEVSGNGYARQTLAYSGVTRLAKDNTTHKTVFKSDNVEFTASGGSIVARYAWFAKSTGNDATSPVIAYVLLDTTPANVTATDGQKLRITMPAAGWFTLGQ